eukprot:2599238-Prymnesium_polylepis.1
MTSERTCARGVASEHVTVLSIASSTASAASDAGSSGGDGEGMRGGAALCGRARGGRKSSGRETRCCCC